MRVLVACEFSGIVAQAFRDAGHDAWSCDIIPSELCDGTPKQHKLRDGDCCGHIIGDVLDILEPGMWDLMIAHPPCTHLCVSGARWFETKQVEQRKAIYFFKALANAPVPKIAIENPVGVMSTLWRKPDQYIQPWEHGHGETKKTGLWLKGLPLLKPSNIVKGREARIHHMSPGPNRGKERSRFYPGIAEAMADQWGKE